MRVFDQRIATSTCTSNGFSFCAMGLVVIVWLGGCGAVLTEIPELDTADGRVFAQRCGACHGKPFGGHGITHGVPDPRFRTMEEWQEELSPRIQVASA